jgi:hypothetical protein
VAHIIEDRERLVYDLMGLPSLDVDYEADSAGIVFHSGIVQALRSRRAGAHPSVIMVLTHHSSLVCVH